MNVREEDRQKNSCPSRGLGLAAAAIGVGVGAALYYFFSKRPENPEAGGSTTQWSCEQPHAFNILHDDEDNSYITISENSTTDTSMYTSEDSDNEINGTFNKESSYDEESSYDDESNTIFPWWHCPNSSSVTSSDSENLTYSVDETSNDENLTYSMEGTSNYSNQSVNSMVDSPLASGYQNSSSINILPADYDVTNSPTDLDTLDYDVTDSSLGVPDGGMLPQSPLRNLFNSLGSYISPRRSHHIRTRERSWSLEECSICFDVILKDQQVTTLPCTHHFHSECITPWLQEQQTCPNCRKAAE
ncbi:unnamed protein product [Diatraea saccharalis]|uniref:RING-type domain-containing protein n=1 Tax=Diatraea saccharalis TaxID=40085 RepID=A0A9N9R4F3_9NEOP|nr:unnamed protein product [Diatraea saccharalis]